MIAVRTSSRLKPPVERSITVSAPNISNGQAQLLPPLHQVEALGSADVAFHLAPRRDADRHRPPGWGD